MVKTPLLSMAQASADVTAGIPGRCALSVRVLDDVSLSIHAGELLLLQAPEALAQTLLLAAMAGGPLAAGHRYVRATRNAATGLRIRRAALHHDAIPEIMRGWQDARGASVPPTSGTVYLLRAMHPRVTDSGPLTPRAAAEWRRWGRSAHERRDGVMIVWAPRTSQPDNATHSAALPATPPSRAHETVASYHPRDFIPQHAPIRLLELRAGRLYTVRSPRPYTAPTAWLTAADPAPRPWCSGGSTGAPPPTACCPDPTTSPES